MEDENLFFDKVLISSDENCIKEYKPFNFKNIFQKTPNESNFRYIELESLLSIKNSKKNISFSIKCPKRFPKDAKKCKQSIKYDDIDLSCFKNDKYEEYILFITENSSLDQKNTIYLNFSRKNLQKLKSSKIKYGNNIPKHVASIQNSNQISRNAKRTRFKRISKPKNYRNIVGFNSIFDKSIKNHLQSFLPCQKKDISVTTVFHVKNNEKSKKFLVREIETKTEIEEFVKIVEELRKLQTKQQNRDFPIKNIRIIIILNQNKVEVFLEEGKFDEKFIHRENIGAYTTELNHKKYINIRAINVKIQSLKWYKIVKKFNNIFRVVTESENYDSLSITKANSSISIGGQSFPSSSSDLSVFKSINIKSETRAISENSLNKQLETSHNIPYELQSNTLNELNKIYSSYLMNKTYFKMMVSKICASINSVFSLFNQNVPRNTNKFFADILNNPVLTNRCSESEICQHLNLTQEIYFLPSVSETRYGITKYNWKTYKNRRKEIQNSCQKLLKNHEVEESEIPKNICSFSTKNNSAEYSGIRKKNLVEDQNSTLFDMRPKLLTSSLLSLSIGPESTTQVSLDDIETIFGNFLNINEKITKFTETHSVQNLFNFNEKLPHNDTTENEENPLTEDIQKNTIKTCESENNSVDTGKKVLVLYENKSLAENIKKLRNILDDIEQEGTQSLSTDVRENLKELCLLLDVHLEDNELSSSTPTDSDVKRKLSNNLMKLKDILKEKRVYRKSVASQADIIPQKIEIIVTSKSNPCSRKIRSRSIGACRLKNIKTKIEQKLDKITQQLLSSRQNKERSTCDVKQDLKDLEVVPRNCGTKPIQKKFEKQEKAEKSTNNLPSIAKSSFSNKIKPDGRKLEKSAQNIEKPFNGHFRSSDKISKQSTQNCTPQENVKINKNSKLSVKQTNKENVKPITKYPKEKSVPDLQKHVRFRVKSTQNSEANIPVPKTSTNSKSVIKQNSKASLERLRKIRSAIHQNQLKKSSNNTENFQTERNVNHDTSYPLIIESDTDPKKTVSKSSLERLRIRRSLINQKRSDNIEKLRAQKKEEDGYDATYPLKLESNTSNLEENNAPLQKKSSSKASLERLRIIRSLIYQNKAENSSNNIQKLLAPGKEDNYDSLKQNPVTLSSQENIFPVQKKSSMRVNFILNPKKCPSITDEPNKKSSTNIKTKQFLSNRKEKSRQSVNKQDKTDENDFLELNIISKGICNLTPEKKPSKQSIHLKDEEDNQLSEENVDLLKKLIKIDENNVVRKPRMGENLIKFFDSEDFLQITPQSDSDQNLENLSDFKQKIFIVDQDSKQVQESSTLIEDIEQKTSQTKETNCDDLKLMNHDSTQTVTNLKHNQQTDCCDLIEKDGKRVSKETSCEDLGERIDAKSRPSNEPNEKDLKNIPEDKNQSEENNLSKKEKNLKALIRISQKMHENIALKKKELLTESNPNSETSLLSNTSADAPRVKKYDFVQMKAELLSLITEVKESPQIDKEASHENIKLKIEENLAKLSDIIQAFKEDKKQKLLTPGVQESLRKLAIIQEENQEIADQKSLHKIFVNVIPKTRRPTTEIERKIELFKNMHATLEKITQKMEKNSLIINKVSNLKKELRKILGIEENIKPKHRRITFQDISRNSSCATFNSVMRTKQEITKNMQNSLLLLKNLNEVIKNSKQNPENAMNQLREIENSLVAQTGKITEKNIPSTVTRNRNINNNNRLRTSKASISKSKFSMSMPFIKSTHPVEIKPERPNNRAKLPNNPANQKNSIRKIASKSLRPKIMRREICSPITKSRNRTMNLNRKSSRTIGRRDNTGNGFPVVETSRQLQLLKIYRPTKSKFSIPVEADMTNVPLYHLTPFRSEYPRKDHLSQIEVEDTYLYKIVNNVLGSETIEPLVKCGEKQKSATVKKRPPRKKEFKSLKDLKKNFCDKNYEDIWCCQSDWDREIRKSLYIEPPTPPPTPNLKFGGVVPNNVFGLDKLVSEALKFHPRSVQENMKDLLRGVSLDKNLKPRNKAARVRTPIVSARSRIGTPTLRVRNNSIPIDPKIHMSTPTRRTRTKQSVKKKKAVNSVIRRKCVKNNDVLIK